jgi:uncharacterized protein DUF6011
MTLTISPELQSLIPPLSPEELHQLEANIVADGCRDPLIIWAETQTLLDGHHRYAICERHGLTFTRQELSLPDLDAAKLWMIANQLGRRNLSLNQMSYYRGEQYNLQKRQGKRTDLTSRHNGEKFTSPAATLAAIHKVGERTIERDGAYATAVETLAEVLGPDARKAILAGDLGLTKQDVPVLASLVEASPVVAAQAHAAMQSTTPSDGLRAILTASQCGICHRPLSNPASVSRGIGPVCAGHGNGGSHASGSLNGAPALVLEPETPAVKEMPPSTLTERDRACAGPRDEKEPGSIAWCWQTLDLLKIRWQRKGFTDQQFRETLQEIKDQEVWQVLPPEAPYGSFAALLEAEVGPDCCSRLTEVLPWSNVAQAADEAMWNLEKLEAFYHATPQLFELHRARYLELKESCVRFVALVDPAALAPSDASAPDPTPARLRDQVGLQPAVFQTVEQLQPCTNAQVTAALGEPRSGVHAALQALVKKGKLVKAGKTYGVAGAPLAASGPSDERSGTEHEAQGRR